jgi:membrane protein required for colicin V production
LTGSTAVAALDWILLAVLLLSCLIGMWRGLVYEALVLAGWVAAYFVARWGAAVAGGWLPMNATEPALRYWVGFALLFVVTAFLCAMLAWLARRCVRALGARTVDRTLGALFGLTRGVALLLVVAALVGLTPLHEEPWWTASVGAHWLERALAELRTKLPIPVPDFKGKAK